MRRDVRHRVRGDGQPRPLGFENEPERWGWVSFVNPGNPPQRKNPRGQMCSVLPSYLTVPVV